MESNVTPIKFRNTASRRRAAASGGKQGMDFLLFFAVCAISLFGLVMLFSASYYKSLSEQGNVLSIFGNQGYYLVAGVLAMYLLSLWDYHFFSKKWVLLIGYFGTALLLLLTLFFGKTVLGARRWLEITSSFRMQPSELVKFVLVVCMASYMSKYPDRIATPKGFIYLLSMVLLPVALIYFQPNMSMIIIIVVLSGTMLFLGGAPWKYLLTVLAIGAAAILVLVLFEGYRMKRLYAWQDPWSDPTGNAYQVIQSMYAFANGGFTGQGFNNSRQKLLFLPEMENDYILAIIAEELGFVGVIALLAAFAFVIWRGIRIGLNARDRFGRLTALGITLALAFQVMVNVGVVTNFIPSTGQSLPFISSGGSSLVVFFAAIGVLLNISRNTKVPKKPAFKDDNAPAAT